MNAEHEQELLVSILHEIIPDECALLGEGTITQLLEQRAKPTTPIKAEGGHEFDLAPTISIATACISLANTLLRIYVDWKKAKSTTPTAEELVKESKESASNNSSTLEVEEYRTRIAIIIVKHFSN